MDVPVLLRQLTNVACAPIYANTAGNPLEHLCGHGAMPHGGWPLVNWPFGEEGARTSRGQLAPGPGAPGPTAAPVGVMPTPEHMPNTGYLYPLPEQHSGLIVSAMA